MNKYLDAIHSIIIRKNPRRSSDYYGYAKLETDFGIVSVSAGRCDSIWIRGTPEAIIGLGIIEPDWLPGLPGRGATAQTVYFEESGPWLPCGKNHRGRRPRGPRITIRAWGHVTRTVDVQAPLSDVQRQVCEALMEAYCMRSEPCEVRELPRRPSYRAVGNVLYLLPRVEGRAAP